MDKLFRHIDSIRDQIANLPDELGGTLLKECRLLVAEYDGVKRRIDSGNLIIQNRTLFRFHHFDGKLEHAEGCSPAEAWMSLGHGAAGLQALDYYEEVPTIDFPHVPRKRDDE